MKQAIGTLTVLLIAASMSAQNPATTLQSAKANLQGAQPQKQVASSPAPAARAKAAAPIAKPVAHSAPQQTSNVKPGVSGKAATSKSASKASVPANSKPTVVASKAPAAAPKSAAKPSAQVAANHPAPAAQPVKNAPAKPAQASVKTVSAKSQTISIKPATAKAVAKPVAKPVAKAVPVAKVPVAVPAKEVAATKVDVKDTSKPQGSPKAEADNGDRNETSKYISITGRRDPFVSPVVTQSEAGSGCNVGKKCLAIDQISVRGVVKSDSGMIAVVVNALDKAYFLRENDPVFNGYVEKITEDSIIFKETYQDKLGKSFTRDVTKRIQAPAV